MGLPTYRQEGCAINYTPGSAQVAGSVIVQRGLVGIVKTDIAANELGAITTEGVFRFDKPTGAIAVGQRCFWDSLNSQANVAGTGTYLGVAVAAAASGDTTVDVMLNAPSGNSLALVATAASAAVTNSTTETNFDNSTLTIPASSLNAGDIIRVRAQGTATATNSTDTLTVKLKLGSTVIVTTGAVDAANGDIFYVEADIVVRTSGSSGTLVATGMVANGVAGTVTAKPFLLASTAVDTTAALTLAVSAQWSVASASDSCRLDVCNVEILDR